MGTLFSETPSSDTVPSGLMRSMICSIAATDPSPPAHSKGVIDELHAAHVVDKMRLVREREIVQLRFVATEYDDLRIRVSRMKKQRDDVAHVAVAPYADALASPWAILSKREIAWVATLTSSVKAATSQFTS